MTFMDDELRKHAQERLKKRHDFKAHVVAYCAVNAMLIAIWALTGAGYFWPGWVLLGMGVGLVLHAWNVFFRRPITEADIEREMERGKGRTNSSESSPH